MPDARFEKLADLLVNYSVSVRPGDKVVIQGPANAAPLLKMVYVKVLQAGANPFLLCSPAGLDETFYEFASEKQLAYVQPPIKMLYETYDARIAIIGEENTKALSHVDPAKMVTSQRAHSGLMKTFLERAARGELRWTVAPFPTNGYAQDAEMSLTQYEDFLFQACLGDLDDPIGYWQHFSDWQQNIVNWMTGKKHIHITAPETDLQLSVEGRTFINCNGHENIPDGEVFTGPVENSINGHVYFSYPAIENGHEVSGVRLQFVDGRVVKASAEKNESFLLKMLETDEGARRVGEFSFGTNRRITKFTRQILFDEKIGGSFHLALGASYPETGGQNQSAIHWDMICDMRSGGQVSIDNQIIYQNGEFTIPG